MLVLVLDVRRSVSGRLTRPRSAARPLAVAGLAAVVVVLGGTACTGDDEDSPAVLPGGASEGTEHADDRGLEVLDVDGARLSRPTHWEEVGVSARDHAASFAQPGLDGEPTGQLDVFVDGVPAGARADALDAATQGERTLSFRELRSVRRERVDVPGASSAFLTESTYMTETGEPARSVDVTAVGRAGEYVLVRVSSAADSYDADLVDSVIASLELVQN